MRATTQAMLAVNITDEVPLAASVLVAHDGRGKGVDRLKSLARN